jgi:hypothetical protein
MKSSIFWVVGFITVYYKKVHASKPDTPSFKMRYFPAF